MILLVSCCLDLLILKRILNRSLFFNLFERLFESHGEHNFWFSRRFRRRLFQSFMPRESWYVWYRSLNGDKILSRGRQDSFEEEWFNEKGNFSYGLNWWSNWLWVYQMIQKDGCLNLGMVMNIIKKTDGTRARKWQSLFLETLEENDKNADQISSPSWTSQWSGVFMMRSR